MSVFYLVVSFFFSLESSPLPFSCNHIQSLEDFRRRSGRVVIVKDRNQISPFSSSCQSTPQVEHHSPPRHRTLGHHLRSLPYTRSRSKQRKRCSAKSFSPYSLLSWYTRWVPFVSVFSTIGYVQRTNSISLLLSKKTRK